VPPSTVTVAVPAFCCNPEFRAAGHVERAAVGDEQGAAVDLAGRRATEIVRAGDGRVARADLEMMELPPVAAVGDGAGPR